MAANRYALLGAKPLLNGSSSQPRHYNIGPRRRSPAQTNSQWIDFLHDITASDIELAARENYRSVEHLKRYTTSGMAVDQGKTSNLNALTLLGELTDRKPGEVGTTTFRPMFIVSSFMMRLLNSNNN